MKTSFEVLNDILVGEHLAIERYQAYIDGLPDSPLRNHLVAFLTDHKEHAQRIAYFIQTNGGHVEEGTGMVGMLANLKTRLENYAENEPLNMLQDLYESESKGLAKAEELANRYLSAAEKEILAGTFADERNHLRQLQRLREDLLH